MRSILFILCLLAGVESFGQKIGELSDTARKKYEEQKNKVAQIVQKDNSQNLTADEVIQNKLVSLALKNPAFTIDNANIKIAEFNKKKVGSSWLSVIGVGSNVNEFVINNSPVANFYPKYNVGLDIPFDIFTRIGNENRIAKQNITIANALKQLHINEVRAEVLTLYEDFKEKSDLVVLQNIAVENNLADYKAAQKNFENGQGTVEEMNRIYQNYMQERFDLVSLERDRRVAIIQLEEAIGMPLENAVPGLKSR